VGGLQPSRLIRRSSQGCDVPIAGNDTTSTGGRNLNVEMVFSFGALHEFGYSLVVLAELRIAKSFLPSHN
jgi:hypothetical protein